MRTSLLPTFFLGLALPSMAITVTTSQNTIDPDDGETSLIEALQALQAGDTIDFNIPGDGPHYIETPVGGYPAITVPNVTINGYSQTGSSPNTGNPTAANTALIKIVLDSRNGNKKVLDEYEDDDFGDEEAAILYAVGAPNLTVKGLAFIGVAGNDSSEDPNVYDIAFIRNSHDGRVQGCWFGLDPAAAPYTPDANGVRPGIYPASSAVASFGDESQAMVIGAISPVAADANAESNIFIGSRISVHLSQPDVVVAGNRFNILPDGQAFDPAAQWKETNPDYYESLEAVIQNGRPQGMRIGTDGNGKADANEANVFGPIGSHDADSYMEFWRTGGTGMIIAGNRFGIGPDSQSSYVTSTPEDPVGLISIRASSSVLIKSNSINGLTGPLVHWHGSNNNSNAARISLRGNNMSNNLGTMPYDPAGGVSAQAVYRDFLEPAAIDNGFLYPRWEYDANAKVIRGEVPPTLAGATVGNPIIDIYVGDGPTSVAQPGYPEGYPQGRVLFTSMEVDGSKDQDPETGKFEFKVADLSAEPTANQFQHRVVITANWTLATGEDVTSNFSPVLEQQPFGELQIRSVRVIGSGSNRSVQIDWVGGYYPYKVQYAKSPAGPWADSSGGLIRLLGDHNTPSISVTEIRTEPRYFYRVIDNVTPIKPRKIIIFDPPFSTLTPDLEPNP